MGKKKLSPEELEQTTIVDGWVWPLKDIKCWPWLQNEKDLPDLISRHCKQTRVVVEAGGNAGFYVKSYARLFNTVYTFEPDNLNFKCLVANVTEKNVIKMQACIGYDRNLVNLTTSRGNSGMYHVQVDENNNFIEGMIPTIRIDDLNLKVCDLIHLDIEGFEFEALKGAEDTIKRLKPVVALEWMNHGSKFGTTDETIQIYLEHLGYKSVEKVYHENIFTYQE